MLDPAEKTALRERLNGKRRKLNPRVGVSGDERALERRSDTSTLSKRAPTADWTRGRDYAVVVDAGSSGSRVQIYSWLEHSVARDQRLKDGKPLATLPRVEVGVEQGDGWHMKTSPGISTFGPSPTGVDGHLRPLLDHALSVVPAHKVPSTPIFILATAGMRLLPDDQRSAVLDRACRFVQDHTGFAMAAGCSEHIRVISGEEEGMFGWIAVNYLLDGFDKHDDGAHGSTFGFLDMGGASTQIAFEPVESEQQRHANDLMNVHLRLLDGTEVIHPVFVTTWLGYGTNQARERYIDALATTQVSDTHLSDPCLPRGLTLDDARHQGYTVSGSGDFGACLLAQTPMLNKNVPCADEPCLFNGVHVPSIDFTVNRFVGVSEYWYSTQELWQMGGVYDFVAFEQRARTYCSRPWADILADARWHGTEAEVKARLELQCFKAAWIVNVLHEGIGLPRLGLEAGALGDGTTPANLTEEAQRKAGQKGLSDAPPRFQSLDQVGNVAVSWTLGKIVLEVAQSVPASHSSKGHFLDGLGHVPAWGGTAASVGQAVKRVNPMIVVGVIAALLFLWLFKRRGGLGKLGRRKHPESPTSDYQLVSAEEGGGEADADEYERANGSTKLSKLPLPSGLKRGINAITRLVTRRSSSMSSSLPMHAARDGSRLGGRPYSLRHAHSTPNLAVANGRTSNGMLTPGQPKRQATLGALPSSSAFRRAASTPGFSADDEDYTTPVGLHEDVDYFVRQPGVQMSPRPSTAGPGLLRTASSRPISRSSSYGNLGALRGRKEVMSMA